MEWNLGGWEHKEGVTGMIEGSAVRVHMREVCSSAERVHVLRGCTVEGERRKANTYVEGSDESSEVVARREFRPSRVRTRMPRQRGLR